MNKVRSFFKNKRFIYGLYMAPVVAAFSIILVSLPVIKPQAIDSIANSTADVVIGQPDMTSNLINQRGYKYTLAYPWGVFYCAGKLYISDHNNCRILIYNSVPVSNNSPADVVIGQPDMISNTANNGGLSSTSLGSPHTVWTDNNKLIVADADNNRVLIYNSVPSVNGASADVVIGQPNMLTNEANNGGVSAKSLYYPTGVFSDGTKLFIADCNNHRILIFNTIPASNYASADLVIGQPDMASNTFNYNGISSRGLYNPYSVTLIGGNLFVSDYNNNRVVSYNAPFSDNAAADNVIGQAGFDTRATGSALNKLNKPVAVSAANDKLFISDRSNGRVLILNSIPVTWDAYADLTLGGGTLGGAFNAPTSIFGDGTRLFVADGYTNNRVLIYSSMPTTNNQSADIVIGQPDMTSNSANQTSAAVNASTAYRPGSPIVAGGKFFRSDSYNHRILIYNSVPTSNNAVADIVIGQPDMTSHTVNFDGLSARSLAYPSVVYSDGERVFVSDSSNNRVLIYNSIPSSNYPAADIVIGQPNMTTNEANYGGVSARSLNNPSNICIAAGKLFVSDRNNSRVLIFNSVPASNFAAADVVIGQPDMSSNTYNNGGISAKSLSVPSTVYCDGNKVFVADHYNSRGLIYNIIPTNNFAAADVVIGQPDMTSATYNNGGTSARSIYAPHDVYPYDGKLFVTDTYNSRVLIFSSIPTSNFVSASAVLGQPDFTSSAENNGGVSATSMSHPYGVFCDGTKLFLGDPNNHRILIYNLNTTKPVISDVKFDGSGYVSGDTIRTMPVISAKMTDAGGVGGIYINNLKITVDAILYTYASFDASTDSYNSTTGIVTFKVKNALSSGIHNVKIEISDYLGNWGTYEANNLNVNDSSGSVQMDGIPLNYPNPFNTTTGTTAITYKLTVDSDIIVYVFDVRGVLIRKSTYSSGSMGGKAGYNEITWDGKDDFGSTVGNGIYPYRIVSGGRVLGRGKIAVLD